MQGHPSTKASAAPQLGTTPSSPAVTASAEPPSQDRGASTVYLVRIPEKLLALPAECACCGGPTTQTQRLDLAQQRLLVGYCSICARHAFEFGRRKYSLVFASALAGGATALGVPMGFPETPLWLCVLVAVVANGFFLALSALTPRPLSGHTAAGLAVTKADAFTLACARARFAERVALAAGSECIQVPAPSRFHALSPWLALLVLPVLLTIVSHDYHHPRLRVLNLGGAPLRLVVDGGLAADVEPSSGESPKAGRELRVPAGPRHLQAFDSEGQLLEETSVVLQSGREHLYVPGPSRACFWLETAGYGRDRAELRQQPLRQDRNFWILPAELRGWFVPLPEAGEMTRFSGGSAMVLRQGDCALDMKPGPDPGLSGAD
ncbi:MAG TPA: hypothetical protein VFQ61_22515 [Polyangiaceae bacterium]|nr:hypothetical protein [Polyangiaceae bacterium]